MRTIGVILAGGSGIRFGSQKPKQFMKVAGRKILEHTIEAFQNSTYIDELAIVTHKGYVEEVEEMLSSMDLAK